MTQCVLLSVDLVHRLWSHSVVIGAKSICGRRYYPFILARFLAFRVASSTIFTWEALSLANRKLGRHQLCLKSKKLLKVLSR